MVVVMVVMVVMVCDDSVVRDPLSEKMSAERYTVLHTSYYGSYKAVCR